MASLFFVDLYVQKKNCIQGGKIFIRILSVNDKKYVIYNFIEIKITFFFYFRINRDFILISELAPV